MHKGVILLVKATDRDNAQSKAEEFLEEYQDNVWDWYQIGGRWQGVLDGYEPDKDPENIEICTLCNGTGKRKDMEVMNGCNGCSGKGEHPKWPTNRKEHEGDILPLSQCISVVKEWYENTFKELEENKLRAAQYEAEGNKRMQGYMLECVSEILQEQFSFEANVYNTESYDYSVPEDTTGFWAVMVDMHN